MWSRACAGVFAGFFASAALVGLTCWLMPGPWQATIVPGLVAFIAAWIVAASAAFAFADGRRAWAWLSLLALCGFASLHTLRLLGWVA